jgi:hypothetical protein
MALIVQERWGKLNDDELFVEVTGSGCPRRCAAGLSRARWQIPRVPVSTLPGVSVQHLEEKGRTNLLTVRGNVDPDRIESLADYELFKIEES